MTKSAGDSQISIRLLFRGFCHDEDHCGLPEPLHLTGGQLKDFRIALGLTQVQLSELLGVSQSSLSQWEAGTMDIPRYVLAHINSLARLKAVINAVLDAPINVVQSLVDSYRRREQTEESPEE